jgi:hypothetical protein
MLHSLAVALAPHCTLSPSNRKQEADACQSGTMIACSVDTIFRTTQLNCCVDSH